MSTEYKGGYMGLVMEYDLSIQTAREYPWTDRERILYLGGKTMASRIMHDCFTGTTEEKALRFIDWMEAIKKKMNLPAGMDMIKDGDIPQIIAWADKEANPLYPVPVIWGQADFERLIHTLRTASW